MVGNLADAEDVVQEAYVKAYRAIVEGRFDGRAKLETWLRRIVVNASIDALRTRKRAPKLDEDVLDKSLDASASAETALALSELSDWLSELPPEQRATLVLKALEGMSSREIGELLGCTEGAVEQRLVRARAALRERMSA
jgi:RNA polymerase sigma-70 factor (ECF subfamily)